MRKRHSFSDLTKNWSEERKTRVAEGTKSLHREYVLAEIRREVGLTQAEAAERLNITQPAFSAYESGSDLRIGTLQKIVSALGGVLTFNVEVDGEVYPLHFPNQTALA